jgi:hypothetical protein
MKNMEYQKYIDIVMLTKGAIVSKGSMTSKEPSSPYLIDRNWLDSWLDYVQNDAPRPSEINNKSLWQSILKDIPVEQKVDYYILHHNVWNYLHSIYDGEPTLIKKDKVISKETVTVLHTRNLNKRINSRLFTDNFVQSDMMTQAKTGDIMRTNYQNTKMNSGTNGFNSSIYTNDFTTPKNISMDSPVGRLRSWRPDAYNKMPSHSIENAIFERSFEEDKKNESMLDNKVTISGIVETEGNKSSVSNGYQVVIKRLDSSNKNILSTDHNIVGLTNPKNF